MPQQIRLVSTIEIKRSRVLLDGDPEKVITSCHLCLCLPLDNLPFCGFASHLVVTTALLLYRGGMSHDNREATTALPCDRCAPHPANYGEERERDHFVSGL